MISTRNRTTPDRRARRAPSMAAAVVVAAGLAAGVALARPGTAASDQTAVAARAATDQVAESTTSGQGAAGYGAGDGAAVQPAPADTGQSPPATPSTTITIQEFDFGQPVVVSPGSIITVTNGDSVPHTLTFDDGSVDTGTIEPGRSVTVQAPSAPGTFTFFCRIHPSMAGQLTVAP